MEKQMRAERDRRADDPHRRGPQAVRRSSPPRVRSSARSCAPRVTGAGPHPRGARVRRRAIRRSSTRSTAASRRRSCSPTSTSRCCRRSPTATANKMWIIPTELTDALKGIGGASAAATARARPRRAKSWEGEHGARGRLRRDRPRGPRQGARRSAGPRLPGQRRGSMPSFTQHLHGSSAAADASAGRPQVPPPPMAAPYPGTPARAPESLLPATPGDLPEPPETPRASRRLAERRRPARPAQAQGTTPGHPCLG